MGRPDSVTFPGGNTQTYQYDALMRIERIQAPEMDYAYMNTFCRVFDFAAHNN